MADWIEDFDFDWGEPAFLGPLRERIRENQFLDAIQVVAPADPCGRQRPHRLAGGHRPFTPITGVQVSVGSSYGQYGCLCGIRKWKGFFPNKL